MIGVNSCNVTLFARYSKIARLPFRAFDNIAVLIYFLCIKDYSIDKVALKELLESI